MILGTLLGSLGAPFSEKNVFFAEVRFLVYLGSNFGRGRSQGRAPPESSNMQILKLNSITPGTLKGGGEYLKASPLPPAPSLPDDRHQVKLSNPQYFLQEVFRWIPARKPLEGGTMVFLVLGVGF